MPTIQTQVFPGTTGFQGVSGSDVGVDAEGRLGHPAALRQTRQTVGNGAGPATVAALIATAAIVLSPLPAPFLERAAGEESPAAVDAAALTHATALSRAFRHAAEVATPSVVVVRSETKARQVNVERGPRGRGRQEQGNPFEGTPFEDFFRDGLPEGFEFRGPGGGRMTPRKSGLGSGVIVDASGIVLTNNHVVEDADSVTVELSDGRTFKAREIKTDPDSDLAVIRLEDARDLPTARLGDSDSLEIGDWVIAIGNPFELETTVSAGIISGKGRELGSVRRAKFLQTDAAINPGNSGGPLVNLQGEVIGINTAIASNSGGYQGIGFAIPVNLAKWVSGQLIAKGSVERGYLGVSIGPLEADVAEKLATPGTKGVLVTEVMPGSPAEQGGMKELDIVTSFDGTAVDGPRSLQEVVERSAIGKPHDVVVVRGGREVTLKVAVKPLPEAIARRDRGDVEAAPSGEGTFYAADLGLEVRDKDDDAEAAYPGAAGVVVERLDADGIAAAAGLAPGLLIRRVGTTEVKDVKEFEKALAKEKLDDGVLLQVRTPRGNQVLMLRKE
jgi:serine protease Do